MNLKNVAMKVGLTNVSIYGLRLTEKPNGKK